MGLELMPEAAEHARAAHGVDVHVASLEDADLPERAYDAVSALHVVEHVPDVAGFLREMARRARPGGHVLVEVPNLDSRQRAAAGADRSTSPTPPPATRRAGALTRAAPVGVPPGALL